MLVLPLTLPAFGIEWLDTAAAHLPGGATFPLLGEEVGDLLTTTAVVVLVAWPVAAMATGAAVLLRRDAD